jgi:hypothetical protein
VIERGRGWDREEGHPERGESRGPDQLAHGCLPWTMERLSYADPSSGAAWRQDEPRFLLRHRPRSISLRFPADGLGSWTTAGRRRTAPGEPGAVSRWTGTVESVWSYGVELQRVQVCRYRARCCHRFARPALPCGNRTGPGGESGRSSALARFHVLEMQPSPGRRVATVSDLRREALPIGSGDGNLPSGIGPQLDP